MDKELVESRYRSAAASALECFSIQPKNIELVAHSENVTFRVTAAGSHTRYALRLHRPGYNTLAELESERSWTKALNAAGIAAPEGIATRQGKYFTRVDIPATDEQRYAGMTRWAEGSTVSDYLDATPARVERVRFFRRIGEMAAMLHNQATNWQVPPGFGRPRLDRAGLLGETPRWGRFWEHADLSTTERKLLLRARAKISETLRDYGESRDHFSLIHADLHPGNIVYDGSNLALIDFDDSAYGWHLYDIASALIEDRLTPGFDALRQSLLEGYRAHRPLAERDVDMLPDFLLLRGMAIIGWLYQRPEHGGMGFFEELKNWVVETCSSKEQ